jgi:uncharacterized cupin superfamily protein
LAQIIVWECSEGKFNWYYDLEETLLILEGSVVLENDTISPIFATVPATLSVLRRVPTPNGLSRAA